MDYVLNVLKIKKKKHVFMKLEKNKKFAKDLNFQVREFVKNVKMENFLQMVKNVKVVLFSIVKNVAKKIHVINVIQIIS